MKISEGLAFARRIKRLAQVCRDADARTEMLVGTILQLWTTSAYPALQRPNLPSRVDLAAHPAVVEFALALEQLDFLSATYWLSSAYAMWGDEAYRKNLAMFFTPPSITQRLLQDLADQGVDFSTQTFYDPACGGAAFLAPIAMKMRDALRSKGRSAKDILARIQERVLGSDVDETLCELSRHFLRMVLADEIARVGSAPRFQVRKANSLTSAAVLGRSVDVVVCNPPYRKMPASEVANLRKLYGEVIDAQPNLYGLFIALSVRLLKVGGTAALVTPTSYLSGQYFSRLRTFLLSNADVLRIGMVSDRKGIYIDVQQETALTMLRRTQPKESHATQTEVSVVAADGSYKSVGLSSLPNSGTTWPIPRSPGDEALLRKVKSAPARLSDYGYAIRVGSFVWNRDTRETYASASEASAAGANSAVPLLWSRDIKGNSLVFDRDRGTDGDHPFVDMGSVEHSFIVRRPSVLLQRVTSNDQPRRLVGAEVSAEFLRQYGGFVGENHTIVLENSQEDALLSPRELLELLSTATLDRYFRCMSGATNVSVFELSQLNLPAPQELRKQLDAGLSMEAALRKALDARVSKRQSRV